MDPYLAGGSVCPGRSSVRKSIPPSHHHSTRSARSVFHRLGSPRLSSSKKVLPG
jgi:hypothetical protein